MGIPEGYDWTSLTSRHGAELEAHYVMPSCGKLGEAGKAWLPQIFTKAQNKITRTRPSLFRLIDMVDQHEMGLSWAPDVKGDIYEGLLDTQRRGHEIRAPVSNFTARRAPDPSNGRMRPPRAPGPRPSPDPACGDRRISSLAAQ